MSERPIGGPAPESNLFTVAIRAALMVAGGLMEVFLGVPAEKKALENVTEPPSSQGTEGGAAEERRKAG